MSRSGLSRPFAWLYLGFVAACAGTGLGYVWAQSHPREIPLTTLSVGDTLPGGFVFDQSALRSVAFSETFPSESLTVAIFFSIQCSSCTAEAMVWQEIDDSYDGIGIALYVQSPDTARVATLREAAKLSRAVYIATGDVRQAMHAWNSPTIYMIRTRTREILFAAEGPRATTQLERYIARTIEESRVR